MRTDPLFPSCYPVTMKYTIEIPLITHLQLSTSGSPGIPDGGVIQLFENRLVDEPLQLFASAKYIPVQDSMIRNSLVCASLTENYALVDCCGKYIYRSSNYSCGLDL